MISQIKLRTMSNEAISFTRMDLSRVIDIQEIAAQDGYHCPKLLEYMADYEAVIDEQDRRKTAARRAGRKVVA